jgi:hypothetical protein
MCFLRSNHSWETRLSGLRFQFERAKFLISNAYSDLCERISVGSGAIQGGYLWPFILPLPSLLPANGRIDAIWPAALHFSKQQTLPIKRHR